jgi:lycopene beta-cyclase
MLELGWEKSLARRYRFDRPHSLDRPVLVDAASKAGQAARFFRCWPVGEDRLIVEDVHLSEIPAVDPEEAGRRIDAYVARRGWTPAEIEDGKSGMHPLAMGGDFAAFWRVGGARVAKLGLRGGFFHPATGHSLPDALRTATLLSEQRDFGGGALHDLFEQHAAALWRKRDYYRGFNKALFASPPTERMRRLERFYGLDPGLIARFHSGQASLFDKRRIGRD